MRFIKFSISALITIGLIYFMNNSWAKIPPIGKFLSPQQGFWQNAEPVDQDFNLDLNFSYLKDKVDVYLDDRLVPHVFANNEEDAFFVQGFLHAKFRLWQMEFQTHAAAGRLSEILGPGDHDIILNADRNMRRLGMVYAAKNALIETENNPVSKMACDSYTAGVNSYIENLNEADLPLEYKLLNYKPEKWGNIKTALFLKYMSLDLAGGENDFEYTNVKALLSGSEIEKLYPAFQDSLDPIVPKGTIFPSALVKVIKPASADSLYFSSTNTIAINQEKPDPDNGSNNWAVAGSKTLSKSPILANDPHLGLNMPSLWFEMQISTPQFNAYGASFPGAPSIIIGFNDSCAWGFTNAMRDVRDYYNIEFKDTTMQEYMFDGEWKKAELKIEEIQVKGKGLFKDTVAYTIFGPVMYDQSYNGNGRVTDGKYYAVRWKAHDPSNELMIFYALNHAKNYQDYTEAIKWMACPGQNCLFASKSGDIAIWQQGVFPAKWRRQGDFVMPGTDSSYMWQGFIPQNENPHVVNPERGFVSSANQLPVDSSYPYYIGGHHDLYRGLLINRYLHNMTDITVAAMQKLQTENYNIFAETAVPVLLKNIHESELNDEEKSLLELVRNWNLRNDAQEKAVGIFTSWFDSLENNIWLDELSNVVKPWKLPEEYTLIEALLKDSAFSYIDNIETPEKEDLPYMVTLAFKKAFPELLQREKDGKLEWAKFKDTGIRHLLRQEALSRFHLNIGGGTHVINAAKQYHGPSWRMIVQLTQETEAYGIYPGGQSGNPGSKYYDNFVTDWAAGKYYTLWMMKKEEAIDKKVKAKMTFSPKA